MQALGAHIYTARHKYIHLIARKALDARLPLPDAGWESQAFLPARIDGYSPLPAAA